MHPSTISDGRSLWILQRIGKTPGLWGCTQGAVQFMVYEAMRSKLQAYHGTEQLSPADTMLATTIAKSASMIITNPITVLTVRMRDAGVRGYKYDNIWNSIRSILAKDGVLGFYRGVLVSLVRVMPAQWCTFVTYECVKDAILRYQEANCPGCYMTQNGVPRHDPSSTSERYGNRWYDYQNQLKKRYGPGADLLIRMGYVPDARDHTVHANPNHGRRGLGFSPESQEGPAFRRGHGPRDANREELQEPLDKCHWNIGEDRFTHEELAAVPYAEEEPLTTLSDDEGLPVPEELEDADFIAMRARDSRVAGEKKRGRGLANRKMKKAAKLQKKLLAVEKRRERNSAAVSPQAQLYTEFRGSTERIIAPARSECISDAGEKNTSRREETSKERADKERKCRDVCSFLRSELGFALPHTFYSEWSINPSQSLVYLYVSCKDRVQQAEEFTKEAASGRPYRGFGTSTTAARAAEEHWKSKNFDTLVYYTVASRSSKITDRLL
ncbi:hypothetical protein FOZ62_031504, partial [Perkinsus olseni]